MSIASKPNITAINVQQIQQRHILNMMGIECWVGRSTKTVHISEDMTQYRHSNKHSDNQQNAKHRPISPINYDKKRQDNNLVQDSISVTDLAQNQVSQKDIAENSITESNITQNSLAQNRVNQDGLQPNQIAKHTIKQDIKQDTKQGTKKDFTKEILEKIKQTTTKTSTVITKTPAKLPVVEQYIEAFTLLGVGFADWVLLVDSQHLHQGSTLPLWRNIITSISLTEQSLSFPICQGMQNVELANASLAGFVFCIAQDDNKRVAALTPLPKGLEHERLVRVPQLTEMLADGGKKRQLWQLLLSNSTHTDCL
ncbi:hypothetical protein [Psychrobacter sp. I-STPA10]|uniref:hypothetical protein n=1 Tax=Psychrobacter sp. I-STPA10 TaxID=2585769 RepID=UPI001E6427F1|nr:hypothetical protein [Psychrobacter sp. I-STPA10]